MPRALLIVNPQARSGRPLPGGLDACLATLKSSGYDPEIQITTRPTQATHLARDSRQELVVAFGGDGTVHEVASGLQERPPGSPPPALAVIPAGTGNDIAQLLGVADFPNALAALARNQAVLWDTIEIGCQLGGQRVTRHALLFAGTGFVGDVIRYTTPRVKRWCGPSLSYAVGFFRALAQHRAISLQVRGPNYAYDGPLLTALVANAPVAGGGGMRLGPGAKMDDGVFDVSIIRSVRRGEVARQFYRLCRGTHIQHRAVQYFPSDWLEVTASAAVDVAADGELIGTTPARFVLRPRSLRLVTGLASAKGAQTLNDRASDLAGANV